ncbi:MAG: protein-tyrosine-phosphatase [Alphaproteobacteria bacterium CG_4_9_14_3_um_filter_47_13]|nr:MAG: protein-tyrosine-phosphatase [Alphaproteobacteria bacterium CG_4_9_14_3_um_filter_47_13]
MNILFLCTGNSARSIIAEAIYNHVHKQHGYSHAFSAGSKPSGKVNPFARSVLQKHGHSVEDVRSKNVDEFMQDGAPVIDLVISVCDSAANDCPVWLGQGNPERLHWPLPDPKTEDDFEEIYLSLKEKIVEISR